MFAVRASFQAGGERLRRPTGDSCCRRHEPVADRVQILNAGHPVDGLQRQSDSPSGARDADGVVDESICPASHPESVTGRDLRRYLFQGGAVTELQELPALKRHPPYPYPRASERRPAPRRRRSRRSKTVSWGSCLSPQRGSCEPCGIKAWPPAPGYRTGARRHVRTHLQMLASLVCPMCAVPSPHSLSQFKDIGKQAKQESCREHDHEISAR